MYFLTDLYLVDAIIQKLGWKTVAGGLIVLGILFLGFVTLSFTETSQKAGVTGSSNSESKTVSKTDGVDRSAPSESGKSYLTPYFQIAYPSGFNSTTYAEQEGVLGGVLFMNALGNKSIEVTAFDEAKKTINSLSAIFRGFGYSEEKISGNTYQGIYFSGVLKGSTIFEQTALIKKDTIIIKIHCMYPKDDTDMARKECMGVVNSLQ